MATNLKGKGRFASILLLHGEKIAIGVVAVVTLWFIYRSFNLPRLGSDFQADRLQNEINQTTAAIKDFIWDGAATDHPDKVKKAQTIAAKGDMSVPIEAYVPSDAKGNPILGFDVPIVAPLILRRDPVMLSAVDVRATGGSGLLAFVDEEIRKKQAIKLAEQEKEEQRKAIEKQKKGEKKTREGGAAGGKRRGPEGPGEANEPIDSAH